MEKAPPGSPSPARPPLTVVSFWTRDWEYEARARNLARQCDALGVPHWIRERPDRGWLANTRQKPRCILEGLDRCGPVLWIDTDGGLYRFPDALVRALPGVDFAAVERTDRRLPWKWHVGVLAFNDTPAARQLLQRWITMSETDPRRHEGGDDWTLELVWRECWPEGLRTFALPASYHAIGAPGRGDVAGIDLSKAPSKMRDHRRVHPEFRR